jgi:small-conductance mechanosensitive channel
MQFIVDLELDYLSKLVQQLTKVINYLLFAELCLYISGELCVSTSYREAVLTTEGTRRVNLRWMFHTGSLWLTVLAVKTKYFPSQIKQALQYVKARIFSGCSGLWGVHQFRNFNPTSRSWIGGTVSFPTP